MEKGEVTCNRFRTFFLQIDIGGYLRSRDGNGNPPSRWDVSNRNWRFTEESRVRVLELQEGRIEREQGTDLGEDIYGICHRLSLSLYGVENEGGDDTFHRICHLYGPE